MYFSDYIKFNTEQAFSFHAAFTNQANDVHPPLYYCLLHIVCSFFPNVVYSAMPGILLNIIFLAFADILLYYIAEKLMNSKTMAVTVLVFWGISASCFSNVVLIRMYMLQTVQILAVIAYHIHKKSKEKYNIIDAIELVVLIAVGGLTQYYFYIFAATLGLCVSLYFILNKKYKLFIGYATSLWTGVILAVIVFPATIKNHINGYRGSYATKSIGAVSPDKFRIYSAMIDSELFAGMIRIITVVVMMYLICKVLCWVTNLTVTRNNATHGYLVQFNLKRPTLDLCHGAIEVTEDWLLLLSVVFATIAFFYVAVQGSEIINVRYIYSIYPIVALCVGYLLFYVFKRHTAKIICAGCALFVAVLSIKVNGIDWSYTDYKDHKYEVEQLKNTDCVIVNRHDYWWNVLQGLNVYINMDEIRALYDTDLSQFQTLINERHSVDNPVCVAFPGDSNYSEDEKNAMLDTILESTSYSKYTLLYDYYTVIYAFE